MDWLLYISINFYYLMRSANDIFHTVDVHVNCILAYMYVYVEPQILLAQHWMNQ